MQPKNNNNEKKSLVIFFAGGRGTRIQSLNSSVPKPMIPIAGKPILQWGIENLVSQGYRKFIITVSHLADKIIDYFGDGRKFECSIEYYYESESLGNAGALYKLWESGRLTAPLHSNRVNFDSVDNGNESNVSFFYLIADAIFSIDFDRFWNFHISHNALASLLSHPNSHPFDSSLILTDEEKRVVGWLNKEDDRPEWYKNCVNAGLQILSVDLLELSGIKPEQVGTGEGQRKVDLDRDVLKPLIPTGRVMSYTSSEYCKDVGTPDRFCSVEQDIIVSRVETKNLKHKQKAIFFDHDCTINNYVRFWLSPSEPKLLPGVSEAIKLINDNGYLCIVVTKQPKVARDELTTAQVDEIHNKLETLLGSEGAYVDAIYYCPHHLRKGYEGEISGLKFDYDCRKPKTGIFLNASRDFNIDLSTSYTIGDSWRGIQAGKNAGTKTVYITSGEADESSDYGSADYTAVDLLEAVKMIV